jgi:pimeloyl-ACP methyl ester carboxylesterase
MPKPMRLVPVLIAALIMSAVESFSLDLIFKDKEYSFQTIRALGYTAGGAADISEVLNTAYRIREGDDESWYREWLKTAEGREKAGDDFLSRGHRASAGTEFLKASNYYRTAEFFLHTDPHDPRIVNTWRKSRDAFLKAARISDRPIIPVEIPFEGTTLPGYLCLADGSKKKRPLLVVHSGFDGTAEELYYAVGSFAVRRGYNVLLFEGPGQGRVIRVQKIPFRPDWERVVSPVIDFAVRRREVDPKRIALMGVSMGGYLAPRAAAFEKRIRALIANGGVFDFHATARLTPEMEKALDTREGAEETDRYVYEAMKTNPSFRWSASNGLFTFGAGSPSEWLKMTRAYTLKGIAERITCETLVVDSENETALRGQAKALYDALRTKKTFLMFTKEEGAEEHCQMGAMLISNARILDWLDERMRPEK